MTQKDAIDSFFLNFPLDMKQQSTDEQDQPEGCESDLTPSFTYLDFRIFASWRMRPSCSSAISIGPRLSRAVRR